MMLRDYFAGQAVASLGVHTEGVRRAWGGDGFTKSGLTEAQAVADTAYLIADAMLAARQRIGTPHKETV